MLHEHRDKHPGRHGVGRAGAGHSHVASDAEALQPVQRDVGFDAELIGDAEPRVDRRRLPGAVVELADVDGERPRQPVLLPGSPRAADMLKRIAARPAR